MGTPCHQLQKIKTHSNQGFISQCAQGCQIMPQFMVVWSVFGHFPLFSSPSFDTSPPWGHHATNSKKSKPIATKVSYHNVHKGAKSCPKSMVVWWVFGDFPLFSSENPSFDTCPPWGHHIMLLFTTLRFFRWKISDKWVKVIKKIWITIFGDFYVWYVLILKNSTALNI